MERGTLVVIGHKNPDTDAVCAAIAYARLKSLSGIPARPYRAGNVNAQTKWALARFSVPAPPLLSDIHLRLADIMIHGDELITMRPEEPVAKARDLMLARRFSFLPVTDGDGRCLGMITLHGLATAPERLRAMREGERITFYPEELLGKAEGRSVGGPLPRVWTGTIRMAEGALHVASKDEGELVIRYGGPRATAGRRAHDGAAGSPPAGAGAPEIEAPGSLIDLLVALYESSPLRDYVEPAEPTFRSDDLVRRIERDLNRYNSGGFIVTDAAGITRGVVTRVNFLNQGQFRLILVDHNELSQAVDGAEHAEIVEVIDHHRLGARSTDAPITFINKVVGSTCTIIAEMYRNGGIEPDRSTAGIMLSAILSDTVILKSPTTTNLDREIAPWLASLAGVAIDGYGEEMFAAGSELAGLDANAIIRQDQKLYEESGFTFAVSQIEMVGFKGFYDRFEELAEALELSRSRQGLRFACLLATDITRETSLLLFAGEQRIGGAIEYPVVRERLFEMHGVLSRKKQLLPYFLDLLKRV